MELINLKFNGTVYGKKDNYYIFLNNVKTPISNEDLEKYNEDKRAAIFKDYEDHRTEIYTTLVDGVENTLEFIFSKGEVSDIVSKGKKAGSSVTAKAYYYQLHKLDPICIISKKIILANGDVK